MGIRLSRRGLLAASGDPEPDRVILWTHLGQIGSNPVISVHWEVSEDRFFTRLHLRGETEARAEAAYTVKVADCRVFEQARFSVTRRGPDGQLRLGRPGGLGLEERFLF